MMMYTGKKYPGHGAAELLRASGPAEAKKIQEMLRHHCIIQRTIDAGDIRHVAGADAAYAQDTIYASVVVMRFPSLDVVEKTCTVQEIPFPYIPGLLSFREGPAIAEAFNRLTTVPDLLLINGHGYAHPKRIGIASHVGVVLDVPSIGVAQRLLTGNAAMPGAERGSTAPVLDNNETIGMAVRTVADTKPVFVSAGHRVDLAQAVDLALKTTITHRLTEPLWHADRLSRQCRNDQSGR
jgi:deoxyribonuclease V